MDDHRRPTTESTAIPAGQRPGFGSVGKNLTASLDALVRALRNNPAAAPSLVDRCLNYWEEIDHAEIDLLAGSLLIGEAEVFVATEEDGRWILPAFMAGLRRLRPWPEVRPQHLLALASELKDLCVGMGEVDRFRDWLWADGAEGFDVALDLSFSEGLDTAFDTLESQRKMLATTRAQAALVISERTHRLARDALSTGARLPDLQVDLRAYEARVDGGAFIIPGDERTRLRNLCVDANFWAEAQADLILEVSELQKRVPAMHLADLLMREYSKTTDLRVVEFLSRLGEREDPYSASLLAALDGDQIGRSIARAAPMSNQGVRILAGLIQSGPPSMARGAARGLIQRAVQEREAFAAMKQIASSVVFQRFFELLMLPDLEPESRKTLGLLILRSKDPTHLMPKFFDQVDEETALSVLSQAPPPLLWEARAPVARLLTGLEDTARRRRLVRIILGTGEMRWMQLLGRALSQSGGKGWCPATLKAACDKLVNAGRAGEILVPLVQDAGASDDAVLAALRAMEKNKEALREATRFHLREFTQSKDVRGRLRKLRKLLKEEG